MDDPGPEDGGFAIPKESVAPESVPCTRESPGTPASGAVPVEEGGGATASLEPKVTQAAISGAIRRARSGTGDRRIGAEISVERV
jgi:hypothetical protein